VRKLTAGIPWLGSGIFLLGLSVFAFLGIYDRYWADDWCFNADLKTLGFWGTLQGYMYITHYASNRFSSTIFTALLQSMGVFGVQILGFLVVVLWFGGLLLTLWGLNCFFRLRVSVVFIVFATLAIEYYSIYLAPARFQILYWRAAALPYSGPLTFFLLIAGSILWQANRENISKLLPVLIAILSFLDGGFSEQGSAYLLAGLSILWVLAWFYGRAGNQQAKRILGLVSVALIFDVLAMLVLLASPANGPRRAASYTEPASLWMVPVLSIEYTLDFVQSSLRSLIIPYAVLSLLFMLIPFASAAGGGAQLKISSRNTTISALVLCAGCLILIAAGMAPIAYIEKAPPDPRGMIFAQLMLDLILAGIFWLLGNWLVSRSDPQWVTLLAFAILLPLGYMFRPIGLTYAELPRYVQRAQTWDTRDQAIRSAQEQGILQIDVKGIDSAYMDHTLDFKEKPSFWINGCAEIYYGMDEIRATLH